MKARLVSRFAALVFFVTVILTNVAHAYPGGVSGMTLKGPNPGCTCHTSSTSSSVSLVIAGPATLIAGETGNYTMMMTYTSTISKGGIDIATSSGTLTNADNRLKILNGELTQPSSQAAGGPTYTWYFKYKAPQIPGQQTLYATGCAVKNRWNHAPNFTVTVLAANQLSMAGISSGENLLAGSTKTITWTSQGVTNLSIQFSSNGGTTWSSIAASVPASSGSYLWNVPDISSQNCKLKIVDNNNSSLYSESPVFSVYQAYYNLLSMFTGEILIAGETKNIVWSCQGITAISIEFSENNGTEWEPVAASIPAQPSEYIWIVPERISDSCRIRVLKAGDLSVLAVSDIFEIKLPVLSTSIAGLHHNDGNGVPLDTGRTVRVSGIETSGGSFDGMMYIQDSTGGVCVLLDAVSSGIYKGDELVITGKLSNKSGECVISPVYNAQKTDSGKTVLPTVLNIAQINAQNWAGTEEFEGMLITLNNVSLQNQLTVWGQGEIYTLEQGEDLLNIRILPGTQIGGTNAPQSEFSVTGLLSQYKVLPPYNSGYEIIPRSTGDITITTSLSPENDMRPEFSLQQNYPNPFNPSTIIRFTLPEESRIRLAVYTITGEETAMLAEGIYSPGTYEREFLSSGLTSGIYIYKLTAFSLKGNHKEYLLGKMTILK